MSTQTPTTLVDPLVPTLAERLYLARTRAGHHDASTFADVIGIDRKSIYNYEKGRTKPRRVVLNAWAAVCGLTLEELLGEVVRPGGPGGGRRLVALDGEGEQGTTASRCIQPLSLIAA